MKRALITGGTGFVGANLARRLRSDGHEVHLLVRDGHKGWRLDEIRKSVHCHELDFLDAAAVSRTVGAIRPEWIFHLAAHGAYSWQSDPAQIVATNLTALIHLVEACKQSGFEAFVNTGSSSEYGYKDHAAVESERVDPNSLYAVTKAAATHYCRHVAERDKLSIPTLRLYSVYGPYEEPNRLMPQLIINGRRGAYPPLAGPDVARDYVHVDDVSEAYVRAASTRSSEPGAVFNVGSGVQTSLREIVAIAQKTFAITAEPAWGQMGNRAWDTNIWVSDVAKIARELGWRPSISVEQGFRSMAEWFRHHYDDEALAAYCASTNAPRKP